jgi:alpha-tubulin suppressor-like RCC1 family protein
LAFARLAVLCFAAAFAAPYVAQGQVLSAGTEYTCAIDAGGGVRCGGDNAHGQLGDGSYQSQTVPVPVSGLRSGVIAVAASYYRSCALRADGEVLCWGSNERGFLGDGTVVDRTVPTRVLGLGPGSGVVSITLNMDHACVLKNDGAVLCWGRNDFGMLGTGSASNVVGTPTQVVAFGAGSGVIGIAAGFSHTCAVKTDRSLYCWGDNSQGQLGDGTQTLRSTPTQVSTLGVGSGVVAVATGNYFTCAVRDDSAVLCWGDNWHGKLGSGSTAPFLWTPVVAMRAGSGAASVTVSAVGNHACARTVSGAMFCWGANGDGQLGDGAFADRNTPTAVRTLGPDDHANVDAIAAGFAHTCARKHGGVIVCWGNNDNGQLADGALDDAVDPQIVLLDEVIFRDGFQ